MITPEQKARDILERIGIDDAQGYSSGDIVELANLISEHDRMFRILKFAVQNTHNFADNDPFGVKFAWIEMTKETIANIK